MRILWASVFGHRTALQILLHALARLGPSPAYTLKILGSGPLEKRWRRLACRLGVERLCQWLGWLTLEEMREHYLWADVFAFTSLRDTCGTVVLEALSSGVPSSASTTRAPATSSRAPAGSRYPSLIRPRSSEVSAKR